MFVYFDPQQSKKRNFRGPDFFVVKGVKDKKPRNSWVIWEEDFLSPDFVIELTSESTVNGDMLPTKAETNDQQKVAEMADRQLAEKRAETEAQRAKKEARACQLAEQQAKAEAQRAEAADAEIAHLKALLAGKGDS